MLTTVRTAQFKRDIKRERKRGKDMAKLRRMLDLLIDQKSLPATCRDHPLKGSWAGFRDAHIEPDWLLIYRVNGETLELARTGTHSDLFD